MAIRPFNSVEGFSVGQDPQIAVIDANGNVTAANLFVNGVSNLGPVGNVYITGGAAGQTIVTDGNGNLSFTDLQSNSVAPMPYYIPSGESFIVNSNFQGLFATPISIDGELVIDGELIDVSSFIPYADDHILFTHANYAAANAGFTFDSTSGNFAVPGNARFGGNVLPSANSIYNLGSSTQRWNDLYLSNNTIYIGDCTISASTGNLILTSSSGANLEVTGNANVTTIRTGTSSISVNDSGNVTLSAAGNTTFIATTDGANVVGTLDVTGNTTVSNLTVSGTLIAGDVRVSSIANGTSNVDIVGTSGNVTTSVNGVANVLTVTSTGANISGTLNVTGEITVGNDGVLSVSGNTAGVFNSAIDTLNIGLGANTITIGSPTGNVNIRGNVIASNVISSGLVTAQNLTVGDLYSKRSPISAVAPNTVIDQFPIEEYRSAKYTIKASNDAGYQALEVLLIHDDINSIITVYGSLSTTGDDIVIVSTTVDSGNVKLLATGLASNTVVNLMGTYVPD